MDEQTVQTSPSAQEGDLNLIQRIINVFTNPSATFKAVKVRPSWLMPVIIVLVLSLVMTYLLQPVIIQEQRAKTITSLEERGMSQDQIDEALAQSEKFMKYLIIPMGAIGILVALLLSAAVWLFVSKTLLGGSAQYSQMLEVSAYSSLITTLGGFIKLPIMLQKETLNVHFSLATFMSDSAKDTFIYKFLVNSDLFNIWSIAVLCIGIAIVSGLKVKKVWPVVVVLLIVWYLATAALGKLFGG
ncbi:YIP1 family protein [candidate division KSB1 bacterium]|nr:YIP1 family protein [candidate division KSB1 bacterium]